MSEFSSARIAQLFAQADAATTAETKGQALEEVMAHVLQATPGVQITTRRRINDAGSEEIDIGVLNHQHAAGLRLFEVLFFLECKNWNQPVGASAVRDFEGKLRSRGRSFGVLVAANGVTGNPGELRAANEVVAGALRDRIEIVVITREQLSGLRSAGDFVSLLLQRRTALVMTQTVSDEGWVEVPQQSAAELSERAGERRGLGSVAQALQREREHRTAEIVARQPALPDNQQDAVETLVAATNDLLGEAIPAARSSDTEEDWRLVLDKMLDLGAVAAAFFQRARGALPSADILAVEALAHAPNIRHVSIGSRLFADLLLYYALEITNEEDLSTGDAALGLIGLLVEGHWRLDDSLWEARFDPHVHE